jgi:hypothetical protein
MKLIVQVPCLNEEETLPTVLAELPRELEGFDRVEWLVVDDGSTDRTAEVARASGADHLVRLTTNQGLAAAFQAGMDAALKLGADVIVNTDADRQYSAADIPRLVQPILSGDADMVVGDRGIKTIEHFSPIKRWLQRLGSSVVRQASGLDVPDTTSGFRAYNREAALKLQVVSNFTYTLESLIQAGRMGIAVEHVPIEVSRTDRPLPPVDVDRLIRGTERARDLSHLRPLLPAAGLHHGGRPVRPRRARLLDAVHPRRDPERGHQRTRPVADPRRGAGADLGADVRPRGGE